MSDDGGEIKHVYTISDVVERFVSPQDSIINSTNGVCEIYHISSCFHADAHAEWRRSGFCFDSYMRLGALFC